MGWKLGTWALPDAQIRVLKAPKQKVRRISAPRQKGDLISLIKDKYGEHFERLPTLSDETLSYSLVDGKMLFRFPENDRYFDVYLSMPFTKGATERETGRTVLIMGSPRHHIDAVVGQFEGALWTEEEIDGVKTDIKDYGNTVRWINVGNLANGFIGLDYNPNSKSNEGVAQNPEDIQFLSKTLMEYGYDAKKRLFILKPPYIVEREEGKKMRQRGFETLGDWAKKSIKGIRIGNDNAN